MSGVYWLYLVFAFMALVLMLRIKEGFSDSFPWVNSSDYGGWPSVFLKTPYVVRVQSDPLSIPTATYVPTGQPCAYPPCPAPDVYQQSY